jgi:hypothetical protein
MKAYSQGLFRGPTLWNDKIIVSLSTVVIVNDLEYWGYTCLSSRRYERNLFLELTPECEVTETLHLISRSFKLSFEMLFSFPLRYLCSISFSFLYLALGAAYPLYLGIDLKIPDSLEQPVTPLP